MVQIPEFRAKTSPTVQTGTRARPVPDITAAAAAPFEAAAGLASDVQAVSTKFYAAQKSLQRKTEAANQIDYLIKGDENNPGLNKLMFDAQNNPNTNTALPQFEQGFNKHRDTILSGIKDPVVKQLVQAKANELYTNNYIDVQSSVWKNVRTNGIGTLENSLQLEFNQYQSAGGNTAKKNTAIQNITKLIEDANNDGLGLPENYLDTQMQSLYTLEAEKLASDNPNLFLKNYDDGFYNNKISPDNLNTLYKSATSKQTTLSNKSISNIKSVGTSIKSDVDDFLDITAADAFNLSTYNNLLTQAITNHEQQLELGLPGIPEVIEDLQISKFIFDEVQTAKSLKPDDLKEKLDDVRKVKKELSQEEGADLFQQKAVIKLEESLEKIHSKMLVDIKDNVLNMAEQFDPDLQIAEINLFDTDTQSFYEQSRTRYEQSNAIAEQYGIPVQYLKPEEKIQIKKVLENSTDIEEISNVLTNITILGREDTKNILVNLGMEKDAPLYTHLGLLMYNNNGKVNTTSLSLLNGIVASRSESLKKNYNEIKSGMSEKFAFQDILNGYRPEAMRDNTPNLLLQIEQAAETIFMDKINRDEGKMISDPSERKIKELWEESIQMASGLSLHGDSYYGGFQNFGDNNKILLPQNMPNSEPFMENSKKNSDFPTVKDLIQTRMTPELLTKAFTFNVEETDPRTGYVNKIQKTIFPYDSDADIEMKAEDFFENQKDTPWYKTFFDEDGKLFDSIYLETAHDGMYYITIGNPNDGDSVYFVDREGKEVLFNLKTIIPDLISGL